MSKLIDALLEEPARFEYWIVSSRTDGSRGSGTQSDPWNAATISTLAITISSITKSGSLATVVTVENHGFQSGDMVTISGVVPANPPPLDNDSVYVGTFP